MNSGIIVKSLKEMVTLVLQPDWILVFDINVSHLVSLGLIQFLTLWIGWFLQLTFSGWQMRVLSLSKAHLDFFVLLCSYGRQWSINNFRLISDILSLLLLIIVLDLLDFGLIILDLIYLRLIFLVRILNLTLLNSRTFLFPCLLLGNALDNITIVKDGLCLHLVVLFLTITSCHFSLCPSNDIILVLSKKFIFALKLLQFILKYLVLILEHLLLCTLDVAAHLALNVHLLSHRCLVHLIRLLLCQLSLLLFISIISLK